MDWIFPSKRKERCPSCDGAGYLPIEGKIAGSVARGTTVELLCKKCDGDGHTWTKEDLTLESLRELLK